MAHRPPYHFVVRFAEGVLGRAWLNDLPLHKVPTRGEESMTGGANHFLVPGTNRLALEILTLPKAAPAQAPAEGKPAAGAPVMAKIYTIVDASSDPMQAHEIASVDLPIAAAGTSPAERPSLPLYHEVEFELPHPVSEPVYWRSPPADFSCAGTPELVAAVKEIHDALVRRDARRFLELMALRHESYSAAFPGEPAASVERQRGALERFFAMDYVVKPLDLTKVHFEPRVGGRVCYVSGWDDQPVLEAATEEQPGPALRANILFTQHDGRWRVFG